MKQLIINADDLGLTRGVTRGIIDARVKGVVTSTSALMNSPIILKAWQRSIRNPLTLVLASIWFSPGANPCCHQATFQPWWMVKEIFSGFTNYPANFHCSS
jgi:predicted glycoside hydrolase/deacetylase ChbG (UPF0249 family)